MITMAEKKRSRPFKYKKISAFCGIACIIVFFICLLLSIHFSNDFSWTEDYISYLSGEIGDRPIWAARGVSSLILNIGVILSGLFGILFVTFISESSLFRGKIGRMGMHILFLGMVAFTCLGIFPYTLGSIHIFFSDVFFGLAPFVLLVNGYQIGKIFGKKWWLIIGLVSFISFCSVGLFLFIHSFLGYSKAVSELVVLSSIFLLFIIICIKLLDIDSSLKSVKTSSKVKK